VMYGAMRTQRQGATISGVLFLVFAFLGGAFFQIDQLPSGVRQFAPLSPFYWGTTGFQELIRDGAGLAEVLPNVGVLAGIGATGLLIGSSLLRRKIGRGGAV
jgi:ABC-2 type transport system permease protein